jgi:recombinational DNA repair protein RecT
MANNQLTPVQQSYMALTANKGAEAFIKLFEISGNPPEQAKALAEKEIYHIAQLIQDNEDLQAIPPAAIMMEVRKIPLQGVTLDPTLGLAYLYVQDKNKGKVSLEVTGRGKAVQAIAQNILKSVTTECIFDGDRTDYVNGLVKVIPAFKAHAKVIGGIITLTLSDGRIQQEFYRQSHIDDWQKRSAKRFGGRVNDNYVNFEGGISGGFLQAKMLKHSLKRFGINPFPNAYRRLTQEQLDALPQTDSEAYDEGTDEMQPQPAAMITQAPPVDMTQPDDDPAPAGIDSLDNIEL